MSSCYVILCIIHVYIGTIPSELSSLTSLTVFNLDSNSLTGKNAYAMLMFLAILCTISDNVCFLFVNICLMLSSYVTSCIMFVL